MNELNFRYILLQNSENRYNYGNMALFVDVYRPIRLLHSWPLNATIALFPPNL